MIDRHHLLYEKSFWEAHTSTQRLRRTHSLIPRIDREVHEEIHDNCPPVPILGTYVMKRVGMLFEPTDNTFQDIDLLCRAMDKATKHSTTIERELAGLSIEALRLQIPFVREGLVA